MRRNRCAHRAVARAVQEAEGMTVERHAHAVFGWAAAVNLGFVAIEAVAGKLADSTALWADAAHNLSDVAGLVLAWGAARLADRPRTTRRTYGMRKATVVAAVANAVLLILVVIGVGWEAIRHLRSPATPHGPVIIAVALAGVAINGGSAALFARRRSHDVNARGVFLHLMADAAVSLVVVVSGVLVIFTDASWLDAVTGLGISAFVLYWAWRLLRESLDLALDAVPVGVDPDEVARLLEQLPGVTRVHDLHIWAISSEDTALTAHLELPWPSVPPAFVAGVEATLRDRFGINHITLQLEDASRVDPVRCDGCI
jgi:cobalt-zinc-cadmium efflux system protein